MIMNHEDIKLKVMISCSTLVGTDEEIETDYLQLYCKRILMVTWAQTDFSQFCLLCF